MAITDTTSFIVDNTCHTLCYCTSSNRACTGPEVNSKKLGQILCCRKCYNSTWQLLHKNKNTARATLWNQQNPERRKAIQAQSYKKNKLSKRDYQLRAKYDISFSEYEALVVAQCGTCACCGELETAKDRHRNEQPIPLSVHHDHNTNKVIALLCKKCNTGIGQLRDDPALLKRAADLQEGK